MESLTVETLREAVRSNAAAFRSRTTLQPAEGPGGKISPPTFAGAVNAVEKRRIPGRDDPVTCVLLDSVQSQANRMEQALQEALDAGEITLPLISVDFSDYAPTGDIKADQEQGRLLDDLGRITSLQVPHRLADAILRDSELDGKPFRESEAGRGINKASLQNATPVYQYCPTALVFGMWDSTGPKGGLGAKFERAMVSEVVGIGANFGLKTASRIDPIIATTKGIVLYQSQDGGWTQEEAKARKDPKTKKPVLLGKTGKVSEANLGNVTPSFAKYSKGAEGADPLATQEVDANYQLRVGGEQLTINHRASAQSTDAREGRIAPGGVTIDYAEQTTTLSLIALRRLGFPLNGGSNNDIEVAGQTVLAALGLCAATLAFEAGMGLRSRCLLWPEKRLEWELLAKPGESPERFALERQSAIQLLNDAVAFAKEQGLWWEEKPVPLKPSKELVELIRKSQELAAKEGTASENS